MQTCTSGATPRTAIFAIDSISEPTRSPHETPRPGVQSRGAIAATENYESLATSFDAKIEQNIPEDDPRSSDRFPRRRPRHGPKTEAGISLGEFKSLKELLAIIMDAVEGHQRIHDQAGIVHGNISFGNILMTRDIDSQTGHRRGFLVDLDVSRFLDDAAIFRGNHKRVLYRDGSEKRLPPLFDRQLRTGTIDKIMHAPISGTFPFLAIDTLRCKEPHSCASDLESFFWLLVWTCAVYDGAANRTDFTRLDETDGRRLILKRLLNDTNEEAAESKVGWLHNYLGDIRRFKDPTYGCHLFAPYFVPILDCLAKFGTLVWNGRDFLNEGPEVRTHPRVLWILRQTYARLPSVDPAPNSVFFNEAIIVEPYDHQSW
ncbi:hypothetical protein SISNIDRAFT_463823 [Sistotremastrum niveocremeum HHB9708]|uniref:Fungal-type protein kinase domain-containing protein n=1 Tax=Sistotremastrum niveocremeum HHB9708 TaxID=1314777 RepID=A0A164XV93_9AGAM|nr:hypothetical protein SISNIDRAFT_463823 [Sistotremastrum niveocremeum HHB9708]